MELIPEKEINIQLRLRDAINDMQTDLTEANAFREIEKIQKLHHLKGEWIFHPTN